jgi:ribosome-binding factor A
MTTRRAERVSSLIRNDIVQLLRENVNDPRLKSLISVTAVTTASDLKNSKVFVSVMGTKKEAEDALQGFKSAAGYFRHELGDRIRLRSIPELTFQLDDSIERGARVVDLINKVSAEESENERKRLSECK